MKPQNIQVVAFLQNPWFRPGTEERHIIKYRDDQDFHRRVLAQSMSGKRLMAAFGEWYDWVVHWDNANWRAVQEASGLMPPDLEHMREVLLRISPKLVLTFGNQARDAFEELIHRYNECRFPHLTCHHPNARGRTQADLDRFASAVISMYGKL